MWSLGITGIWLELALWGIWANRAPVIQVIRGNSVVMLEVCWTADFSGGPLLINDRQALERIGGDDRRG